MKICMIYYTFSRSSVLRREAEALTERGDLVDIICLGEKCIGTETNSNNLNIYHVQKRRFDERGKIAYLRKYAQFFILSSFLAAILHIKRNYDLIHVTSPPDFFVFTSLFPRLFGAKVILDIHDITPEFFARKFGYNEEHFFVRFLKWIERISAKYSHHVITVTDIWRTTLVDRSVPESKCSVLLNAPDRRIFHRIGKRKRPTSKEFTLLYHGNLAFGLDVLVRAMQIISQEIPSAKLRIYGDGPGRAELIKLVEDIGVSKFVSVRERVSREELVNIMQNVDVGIDPMKGGLFFGEVLTVKSLEFLAMEVPLVISRTKATQYYFDDSTVMFFEPENERDLARAVIELYENPEKRVELVKNAQRFNAIHNWNRYKRIYCDIVDSLCMVS